MALPSLIANLGCILIPWDHICSRLYILFRSRKPFRPMAFINWNFKLGRVLIRGHLFCFVFSSVPFFPCLIGGFSLMVLVLMTAASSLAQDSAAMEKQTRTHTHTHIYNSINIVNKNFFSKRSCV